MINDAYAVLLPKQNQTTPIPRQFLCPFSNISACLPIEGQSQVRAILARLNTGFFQVDDERSFPPLFSSQ